MPEPEHRYASAEQARADALRLTEDSAEAEHAAESQPREAERRRCHTEAAALAYAADNAEAIAAAFAGPAERYRLGRGIAADPDSTRILAALAVLDPRPHIARAAAHAADRERLARTTPAAELSAWQ